MPQLNKELLGINTSPGRNDGTWHFWRYTNKICAEALLLVEEDEFSGMKPISEVPNSRGAYSYEQILKEDQSFGIHIVLREQLTEKWATNDATAYGGTKGPIPGKTPEMAAPSGSDAQWREVTVIKYLTRLSDMDRRVFLLPVCLKK